LNNIDLENIPTNKIDLEIIRAHLMEVEIIKTNASKEIKYAINDVVV